MIAELTVATLLSGPGSDRSDFDTFPLGRAAVATIVKRSNLNSDKAAIVARVTRRDAEENCAEFFIEATPECVADLMKRDGRVRVTANCSNGTIRDPEKKKFSRNQWRGTLREPDTPHASWLPADERLLGGEADFLEIWFRMLCPKAAGVPGGERK